MTREIERITVHLIVELRSDALRHNVSGLKVWGMLGERVKLATRGSQTVGEWCSTILRKLRIHEPSKWCCEAQRDLTSAVGDRCEDWLRWLEAEQQYVLSLARIAASERKNKRAKEKDDDTN